MPSLQLPHSACTVCWWCICCCSSASGSAHNTGIGSDPSSDSSSADKVLTESSLSSSVVVTTLAVVGDSSRVVNANLIILLEGLYPSPKNNLKRKQSPTFRLMTCLRSLIPSLLPEETLRYYATNPTKNPTKLPIHNDDESQTGNSLARNSWNRNSQTGNS